MSNITMPREVVEQAMSALDSLVGEYSPGRWAIYANLDATLPESISNPIIALRSALSAAAEPAKGSQERMLHDFPALAQFHTKHALGPMLPPSCLCCGQQTHPVTRPVAVKHMELPGIVICRQCKDATASPSPAPAVPDQGDTHHWPQQGDQTWPAVPDAAKPEPCQNTTMGEHACKNRHQCWESCGELGHSEKHARPAPKETQDAVNAALGLAAKPEQQAQEPTGCACRWDKDDNRVQTCERHQGWLDVVHEWAERAKSAEAETQSHREAIAKKDAALVACVEALKTDRAWLERDAPDYVWSGNNAAIEQAKEAGK